MRTETELRAAIDELAHDAPDVDALLSSVPRAPRSRGRVLAPIAVAAAVAAAATSIALLRGTDGTHSPVGDTGPVATFSHPCATTSTPDFRTLSIGPVAGLATEPVTETACAGYRQRWLYDTNGGWVGEVTVYAPGVFDAALTKNARQVSGHGITGYEITIPGDKVWGTFPCELGEASQVASDSSPSSCMPLDGLAWEYAANAWGVLTLQRGDATRLFSDRPAATELAIAAAVDTGPGAPIKMPMKLSHLPADVRAVQARTTDAGTGAEIDLGIVGQQGCPNETACTAQLFVQVGATGGNGPGIKGRPVMINGYNASLVTGSKPRLQLFANDWQCLITTTGTSRLTSNDLVNIAKGMTFATSATDMSTWFVAGQ